MQSPELYADILLPLAQGTFSYRVGDTIRDAVAPGMCVEVVLGPRKVYVGIVWKLYGERPDFKHIKSVNAIVPGSPVISHAQMELWEWMAGYYMCELGEVMRAALPSALKPHGFSSEEFARASYCPPKQKYVSLHPSVATRDRLNEIFETLGRRAKKQYEALVDIVDALGDERLFGSDVPCSAIPAPQPVLKQLEKKEVIAFSERELMPGELPPLPASLPQLTPAQQAAKESVEQHFEEKDVVLLHGITGSGKTEIYIHLIKQRLEAGRDVLYLVPEIAMSSQLVTRIRKWFGDRVIAYHSAFTDRARVAAYMRANRSEGGRLILGARSALFLPADKLGLIVVDEEHDAGYKNTDTAPRYNARDAAAVLAKLTGAKVVLGSATPSLESHWNADRDKYGLVTLTERYGGAPLPAVIVSDTLRAVKRGERRVHFNKELYDRMTGALAAGEQVMLFQNRRGFAPYVECGQCGWTAFCPSCNVALSLHKAEGALCCHYCGHRQPYSPQCPSCGAQEFSPRGFGTEKVEEEIAHLFPDARVARLDRDTSRSPRQYERIIADFEQGNTDILIGTQMITKGFDFDGVSLVGILNADNLLAYPDFRASERAFQLITQVAGRAGRRDKTGTVVIQTSHPDNPVIQFAAAGNYRSFALTQTVDRTVFFYPPLARLVSVSLRHEDNALLWQAAGELAAGMRKVFGGRVTGPQPPAIDRIRGEHILSLMLKVERERSFAKAKQLLRKLITELQENKAYRSVKVVCDVDPQ